MDKSHIVLKACLKPKKRAEIMESLEMANKYESYKKYVLPLVEAGLLAMTIPDKPQSSQQQYYTTEEGKKLLKH